MSRYPGVLKWFGPVARMRGDPPQGHVGACSDARRESYSQEAQANTTFEVGGLAPRYGRIRRAAARPALELLVRMKGFRYASVPAYQRLFAGRRAAVVRPRCQRPLGRDQTPAGSPWPGRGAARGGFRSLSAAAARGPTLLAGAGPPSRGSCYQRRFG
jgi:hypothetical protein